MIIQNANTYQHSPPVAQTGQDGVKLAPKVAAKSPTVAPEPTNVQHQDASSPTPSPEQLKGAIEIINTVIRQSNNSLEFSLDDETSKPVVKLVDTETGELIRQYPSEETLAISRSIDRFQQGLLLKQKA